MIARTARLVSKASRGFSTQIIARCGLVATMDNRRGRVAPTKMDDALKAIEHRGPDHQSKWTSPNGLVTLGHTRLSIIDLTGGHQPITNEQENVAVVVNGELYDFERIRSELQQKGYKFKTKSDSEILLHLYQEHGLSMFKHLRGEFAFVIWDDRNQTLIFGRDRFGIKPLYYAYDKAGTLCLASEMKALFKLGVDCKWNASSVLGMTSVINMPIFTGIQQVPPGHYVVSKTSDPSSLRTFQYWDMDYEEIGNNNNITEEEAKHNVRKLLEEAIKFRLRADVPVGVYLSGGLDSCATLAIANTILKRDYGSNGTVDAFSISFDEHKEFDEAPIADRFAQKYGAKFHKIPLRQQEMVNCYESAIYHAENFNINLNFVAKYALSKFVKENKYKVVLSGEGSDEMFLGYPFFKVTLLLNQLKNMDPKEREDFTKKLLGDNIAFRSMLKQDDTPEQERFQKYLGFKSGMFGSNPMLSGASQLVNPEFKDMANADVVNSISMSFLSPAVIDKMRNKWNPVYSESYIWLKTIFVCSLLSTYGDRMELANSVEVRTPFLDHHLVEYVTKLPLHLKIKLDLQNSRMIEKHILRESVKDLLNDELYNRIKHPFFAPPASWKPEGPMFQYIQETLRSQEFKDQPFFDQKKVIGLLDQIPKLPKEKAQHVDVMLLYLSQLNVLQKQFKPEL
jgi:asparagine synthase (glutamine-hydrolysing)